MEVLGVGGDQNGFRNKLWPKLGTKNGLKVKNFIFIDSRRTACILPTPKMSFLSVKTSFADPDP
jgi:hypothetical protein